MFHAFPDNSWTCSPELSWMYTWSLPLISSSAMHDPDSVRCRYDDTSYAGRLFLVMEYYSKHVIPGCPERDNCSCSLTSVQEKLVLATERVYTVQVECADQVSL